MANPMRQQFSSNDKPLVTASGLTYQGQPIHERGEMLSLTDMWRAAGGTDSQRPAKWLEIDATQQFVEYLKSTVRTGDSELIQALNESGTWHTWAHWQIAMAYAKYLSPEFHSWCNQVVRDHMEGRMVPVQTMGAIISLSDAAFREMMLPMTAGISALLEGQQRTDNRLTTLEERHSDLSQQVSIIRQEMRKGRRNNISEKTKSLLIYQLNFLGGRCPCCAQSIVVQNHRRVNGAEFDHFFGNQYAGPDHVWLICKECHDNFTYERITRSSRNAEFNAFQQQRIRTPNAQSVLALVA